MPYVTQIPDATIDLSTGTPVIDIGNTLLLNELYTSQEFELYDVGSPDGATLGAGDSVSLVGADGTTIVGGQYAGTGTLSTAEVGLDVGLISATVQLNALPGQFMVDENGNVFMITDEPLNEDNLNVTLNATLLGDTILDTEVPISGLADVLSGGTLGVLLAPVQQALDTVIVSVGYDPEGTLALGPEDVTCFVAGTLIETRHGLVAVENLNVGDEILTRDNGFQPIRWIGSTKLSTAALARQPNLRPIRIRAGALGTNMPASDLMVSPQHRILVRSNIAVRMFGVDEVLVAAKQLLIIEGIDYAEDVQGVEYFHFLFDRHEVVMSNGAATESLFTGPQALKSVGAAARAEILALFPEMGEPTFEPTAARELPSGRMARKLAMRHVQNRRTLVLS